MSTYSVAEAKAHLPRLINSALAGEEVVITRHGKPVAELRQTGAVAQVDRSALCEWLTSRRSALKGGLSLNSVELLNIIYDEPRS